MELTSDTLGTLLLEEIQKHADFYKDFSNGRDVQNDIERSKNILMIPLISSCQLCVTVLTSLQSFARKTSSAEVNIIAMCPGRPDVTFMTFVTFILF